MKGHKMSVNKILEKEYNYFINHKDELIKQFPNSYLIIKDETVISAHPTEIIAYQEAKKQFDLGTFLIQFTSTDEGNYRQTFHSRVMFNAATI